MLRQLRVGGFGAQEMCALQASFLLRGGVPEGGLEEAQEGVRATTSQMVTPCRKVTITRSMPRKPGGGVHAGEWGRNNVNDLKDFRTRNGSSQDQSLVLTVLAVLNWLDSGGKQPAVHHQV